MSAMDERLDLGPHSPLRTKLSPWEFFVLRHTKPGNLVVHFVSFLMFWGGLAAAFVRREPLWLIPFFLSGIFAAPAHWYFDDGGINLFEASGSVRVVTYVAVMFWMLARGTWWPEVEACRARVRALRAAGEL